MRVFKRTILCSTLLAICSVAAAQINLISDVNRDGAINAAHDETNEDSWTWELGAVFINNNDSDQNTGVPDHADNIVNGPNDLDDFAELIIEQIPGATAGDTLTVSVDSADRPFINIFVDNGASQSLVNLTTSGNLNAAQLASSDLTLFMEANSFATGSWDGLVDVTVSYSPASGSPSSDTVRFRVAPWLMLHNGLPATEVYFREYTGPSSTTNVAMKNQLNSLLPTASASLVVSPATASYPSNNIWMQDALEVGYQEMPGQRMNVVLPSNRGNSWPLSNFPEDELLGPDYGWFQAGSYVFTTGSGNAPDGWLDWFGNLEITPPIPGHPFGRVFTGYNPSTGNTMNPDVLAMLNAQELQGPVLQIDTGWLLIQHVDEVVSWIPTSNGGFKVMVPDTTVMYDLLDTWVSQGYGSQPMLRRYNSTETVSAFRNASSFRTQNLNLQSNRIEPVIDQIKSEWSLTESDLIRVPAAYYSNGGSYVPSMVNSLVVNNGIFVADPHGPEPSGTDLLQQYFEDELAAAGITLDVHFVDDARYHIWSGNVHCATNTKREGFSETIWETLTEDPNSTTVDSWVLYSH